MKWILAIVSFISIANANTSGWVDSLFNASTKYIFKVDKIDSAFLNKASQHEKCDLSQMANPHENYNSTDIIKPGLSRQRLICFGQNGEYILLAYEQGGRGWHSVFLAYKNGNIIKKLFFFEKPQKPNELKEIIEKHIKPEKQ